MLSIPFQISNESRKFNLELMECLASFCNAAGASFHRSETWAWRLTMLAVMSEGSAPPRGLVDDGWMDARHTATFFRWFSRNQLRWVCVNYDSQGQQVYCPAKKLLLTQSNKLNPDWLNKVIAKLQVTLQVKHSEWRWITLSEWLLNYRLDTGFVTCPSTVKVDFECKCSKHIGDMV